MVAKIKKYEKIIIEVLTEYADGFKRQGGGVEAQLIVDKDGMHYQLLSCGWLHGEHNFYVIFHFDIKDGKVWLQENRTDVSIAQELNERGIPKHDIVLGLLEPELRGELGYAVA